jgi:hypothetical protein
MFGLLEVLPPERLISVSQSHVAAVQMAKLASKMKSKLGYFLGP